MDTFFEELSWIKERNCFISYKQIEPSIKEADRIQFMQQLIGAIQYINSQMIGESVFDYIFR